MDMDPKRLIRPFIPAEFAEQVGCWCLIADSLLLLIPGHGFQELPPSEHHPSLLKAEILVMAILFNYSCFTKSKLKQKASSLSHHGV